MAALLLTFLWALYLSKLAGQDISNAFEYQTAVVAAQRDADLLQNSAAPALTRAYRKLLDEDLNRIGTFASSDDERPPKIDLDGSTDSYARLDAELRAREQRGADRFSAVAARNVQLRNLSNALFALVAFLFVIVGARLRTRLERGRSLVERLQHAFLSRPQPLENVGVGAVLLSATKDSQVGGDLFDVYSFDGRYGALLVADVSGKGIDAAVDTAFIKYSMRTLFVETSDPADVLTKFSRLYSSNAVDPNTFVVMFFGVIDTETGRLRYASAGHEPAWARIGGKVVALSPTGPLVGVLDDERYEQRTLQFAPGDLLLLSTDGLTEARDEDGTMLGAASVEGWLQTARGDAQTIADHLVRWLRKRSRRVTDDLAILVVRYEPAGGAGKSSAP